MNFCLVHRFSGNGESGGIPEKGIRRWRIYENADAGCQSLFIRGMQEIQNLFIRGMQETQGSYNLLCQERGLS